MVLPEIGLGLLFAVYTQKLARRLDVLVSEFLADGACQRVALHFPKLSLAYHKWVATQGGTHG